MLQLGQYINSDLLLVATGIFILLVTIHQSRKLLRLMNVKSLRQLVTWLIVFFFLMAIAYEALAVILIKGYRHYLTPVLAFLMALVPVIFYLSIKLCLRLAKEFDSLSKTLEVRVRKSTSTIEEQRLKMINEFKMASLGEMAGGIAHEIKNPLFALKGYSGIVEKLLSNDPLDKDQLTNYFKKINKASSRISKIISGLQRFSRESKQDPFENVNVVQMIEETLEICRNSFFVSQVELIEERVSDGLYINCREVEISQVILNLLNNARNAASENEKKWVRLEISYNDEKVIFAVVDSGKGIPREIRKNIFEPFYTTKRAGKGTGLGLSISRGIAEAHGGSLALDESSENTRFVLTLPRER